MKYDVLRIANGKFKSLFSLKSKEPQLFRPSLEGYAINLDNTIDPSLFNIPEGLSKNNYDIYTDAGVFIQGIKFLDNDVVKALKVKYARLREDDFLHVASEHYDSDVDAIEDFWAEVMNYPDSWEELSVFFKNCSIVLSRSSGKLCYDRPSFTFMESLHFPTNYYEYCKEYSFVAVHEFSNTVAGNPLFKGCLLAFGVRDYPGLMKEEFFSKDFLNALCSEKSWPLPNGLGYNHQTEVIIGLDDFIETINSSEDGSNFWSILMQQNDRGLYESKVHYKMYTDYVLPVPFSPTAFILNNSKWIWDGEKVVSPSEIQFSDFKEYTMYSDWHSNPNIILLLNQIEFKGFDLDTSDQQRLLRENNIDSSEINWLIQLRTCFDFRNSAKVS